MTKRRGVEAWLGALAELGEGIAHAVTDAVVDVIEEFEDFIGHEERPEAGLEFDYDFIAPLAMLKGVPLHHLPTLEWFLMVGKIGVLIHANREGGNELEPHLRKHAVVRLGHRTARGEKLSVDAELRQELRGLEPEELQPWFRDLVQTLRIRPNPGQVAPPTLQAYREQFVRIPLPAIAGEFEDDRSFAELRVAGPNPTSLVRVKGALPAKFPLTEAQFSSVSTGDSLAQAIEDGRAYLVDYGGLQPTVDGTYPQRQKYVYEPIALFVVQPDGALEPIAIQGGQDPAQHPLVLPDQGYAWRVARSMVQVADGNYHELVAHLGRTHVLIEPFPIVTERVLPKTHPLRVLLEPHFEGTLFINWAAGDFLVAPKNVVDELLSGTIDADRNAAVRITAGRTFGESFLHVWLAEQGLDDREKLPHFPFRDDATLLWKAIADWATDYVELCWADDAAVVADDALQAWALELGRFDGGRVAGFGDTPSGNIATRAYLAEAITMVIFTGSAMHAAVNFPQRSVMSFAPAMPLGGYRPAPKPGQVITEQDWLAMLPGLDQALIQLNVLTLLGGVYYTKLGHYRPGTFGDPAIEKASERFRAALEAIETAIEQANEEGLRKRYPYVHLLPSLIPQSINI